MKKTIRNLAILLCSCLFIYGSCSKDDAHNNSGGSFMINGTTYNVTSTTKITSANLVCFSFTSLNSTTFANSTVNFYFSGTSVPATGTYTIASSSAGLGATQVYMMATSTSSSSSTTEYDATGTGTVQVSVNNGKVSISMGNTPTTNSGTVSANVNEK